MLKSPREKPPRTQIGGVGLLWARLNNCAFNHHGVGLVGSYWTHVFLTNPD